MPKETEMKTLPRDPTDEMVSEGKIVASMTGIVADVWRRMYDTAPAVPDKVAELEQELSRLRPVVEAARKVLAEAPRGFRVSALTEVTRAYYPAWFELDEALRKADGGE